jgi:hypothetical protein
MEVGFTCYRLIGEVANRVFHSYFVEGRATERSAGLSAELVCSARKAGIGVSWRSLGWPHAAPREWMGERQPRSSVVAFFLASRSWKMERLVVK